MFSLHGWQNTALLGKNMTKNWLDYVGLVSVPLTFRKPLILLGRPGPKEGGTTHTAATRYEETIE